MSGNVNYGNQPPPLVQQNGALNGCIIYGNFPPKLVQYGQICAWLYKLRQGSDKPSKVPINLHSGQPADPTNPNDFYPLSIAVNSNFDYRAQGFDGLGLGIFGNIGAIDMDGCINDRGELSPNAVDIINTMNSYTEISPSGHGIRILFLATNFQYDKARYYIMNQKIGLEVYVAGCTSKYVSITGNAIHLCDLAERGDRLQIVLDKYMKRPVQNSVPVQAPAPTVMVEDDVLIDIMCKSKNREKFIALMSGDTSAYGGDDSSADLALCNILAFYTDKNPEQMDRIFRRSKLMRAKWDSARGDSTYGKDTIAKAIAGTQQVYTPKNVPPVSDPVAAATIPATATVQLPEIIPATDLIGMPIPPLEYLVDDILACGTTVLAAPPKAGKSMMVFHLGMCVASGTPFLEHPTNQCGVLYLALEDSKARLKDRMLKILDGTVVPSQFYVVLESPTMDTGLFSVLDKYLELYPHIKLVIIDTLYRVRPQKGSWENMYKQDYREIGAIQSYAMQKGISTILVHHTNKQPHGDVFNSINGSQGIPGAVDQTWIISKKTRNSNLATLHITGRDIQGEDLRIQFNSNNFHWDLCGTAEEMAEESARAAYRCSPIVRAIKKLVYDGPDNKWTGFSSALIKEAMALGIEIDTTPQKVGKFIQQNLELFEEL